MTTTLQFLDAVKARHSIESDYKLAKLMGVGQQTISNYRNRKSTMDDSMVLKVANLLEEDPGIVLAAVHAERAKRPEEKAAWLSMFNRLSAAASLAAVGVALAVPAPAEAAQTEAPKAALMIMSNRKRPPIKAIDFLLGTVYPLFGFQPLFR